MEAAMASTAKPFTPVTPPPEKQAFLLKPMPLPTSSFLRPEVAGEVPLPSPAEFTTCPETQVKTQAANTTGNTTANTTGKQATSSATQTPMGASLPVPMDPRQLEMVSRIASYYQQRCIAITNYQQQRCHAWANMQRQKCQETMQAAMLVVAWYVRDRIQRRRRRQKTKFRSGLRERHDNKSKVTKGEVVRRWVMQVPEATAPPHSVSMNRVADKDEANFDFDADVPLDRDTKLFDIADTIIRSQYRKVEVPLMGMLSFDESESESESDGEGSRAGGDGDGEGDLNLDDVSGADQNEEYDDDDDELYDDEDLDLDDLDEGDLASAVVHDVTTGNGSLDDGGTLPL